MAQATGTQWRDEVNRFNLFLDERMSPFIGRWEQAGRIPREFLAEVGRQGWLGYGPAPQGLGLVKFSGLRDALLLEQLAKRSADLTGRAIEPLSQHAPPRRPYERRRRAIQPPVR